MSDDAVNGSQNGSAPDEGYCGSVQAGRALGGINPRTIRRMVERGELEGKHVRSGRSNNALRVSIASVKKLRDERIASGKLKKEDAGEIEDLEPVSDEAAALARAFERMAKGREELAAEAADARARLEITERAQSTMDAELRSERIRREAAELETERLRAELEAERRRTAETPRPKGFLARLLGG